MSVRCIVLVVIWVMLVAAPAWAPEPGQPAWSATTREEAVAALANAPADGLVPEDYGLSDLRALMAARPLDHQAFDRQLTKSFVRFLQDLHQGRVDPRSIGWRLERPDDRHDFEALLAAAVGQQRLTALVAAQRPPFAQYEAVRTALQHYRGMSGQPEPVLPSFATVAGGRTSVHPGARLAQLPGLAERLVVRGDLAPSNRPRDELYVGDIVEAVRRFQARHGLAPDGVIGPETWRALSVPLTWRTRQLELTLERLRWLPHLTRPRFLVINIPMFQLWAWDAPPDAPPSFTTGVIVGRALSTATPVMAKELREVVFRPFWNVPRSILTGEMLPVIQRNPAYLQQNDLEIVSGEGDRSPVVVASPENLARLARGELRLRQRPGPKNALGLVKFVFPNDADIYLHGTPAPALFARARRDFSHGCVRVEDPEALARWVLSAEDGWSPARIAGAMAATGSEHVQLHTPVQVLLFYTTANVMPDGQVRFADDIYRHDQRLDRALTARDRLPGAHAADVNVDEVGGRIETDTTAREGQGG